MLLSIKFLSFEIHIKRTNTLCGQNIEFPIAKPDGTYSNHWALEGQCEGNVIQLCQVCLVYFYFA